MKQKRKKKKVFEIILFATLPLFFGCNPQKVKRINVGEFDMEGTFIDGSIPDGIVKYYLPKTNDVVGTKEFSNGVLNGKSVNYYKGKVVQIINYNQGKEYGFGEVYDSSESFLKHKYFYFSGRKVGPSYEYDENGNLLFYEFRNFENEVLYRVELDLRSGEINSDGIEKLENLNVDETVFNNEKKLRLFFYLIYPPKAKVEYKVCYLDKADHAIDSIIVSKSASEFYWENFINYPKQDQRLGLVITKYDSILSTSQTLISYIGSINDIK